MKTGVRLREFLLPLIRDTHNGDSPPSCTVLFHSCSPSAATSLQQTNMWLKVLSHWCRNDVKIFTSTSIISWDPMMSVNKWFTPILTLSQDLDATFLQYESRYFSCKCTTHTHTHTRARARARTRTQRFSQLALRGVRTVTLTFMP